ncbi:hypothetical protein TSTA_106890 [Talaromyces stipitatus ATCC 10500]|uniref:BAH domain-containing protein n=1 Tax=Talaromyces stipitatus (strain ATCC 10500 / CBS 375.48 / QM 6759 / NRRL 1006) TaxID=441959 RepID=B8MPP0_TALSN|nr:uncharacterized protein TSTA_106890 [Talaromyces stipitatus ATCC 10500]EED14479.1 hypothetical protein TSTA_106890 [Talaromyces stipitatus ATCC 10500]
MDLDSDICGPSDNDYDVQPMIENEGEDCPDNARNKTSADSAPVPVISQAPPPADVLYLTKGDGVRNLSPRPVDGAKPWRQLARVSSAPLETWDIHLGDIVQVCLEKDRKSYAKISEIRRLDDGRYVVVYTWLYRREEVQAEFETDGIIPRLLRRNLDKRWPADATFQYMLSTNRTITLWDTAISRAPRDVVESVCHSSIYSTTPSTRYIWSVNSPRFKWMKKIHDLGTYSTI